MSDSSRVQLAGIAEVTWGTTPASALAAIRYTTENLGARKETQRSEEVRSDRQTTDIVEVGKSADGGFDFEASAGAHDPYIEGMMNEAFSTDSGFSAATVSAASADNSFNDSGSGFPTLVPGQWIRVSGYVDPANNGWFEVVSRTAAKIIVTGGTLVVEAVGPTITITDSTITNGTTKKSYTMEKFFSDITQYYALPGCRVDTLSLSIASRQRVTGTFGFMGKGGALAAATAGSGAYSAAPTNPVLNASANVARILEGGAVLGAGVYVQQLDIEFANNLRAVDGVGSVDSVEIGVGRFNVTGSMSILFQNEVIFNKYLNHTASSINSAIEDANGKGYMISLPRVHYSNADVTGVGNDDEITADLEFEAIMDPTEGIMARIDRA
jgi:Phage tail tube protein